jgi:hypothetical protein
MLSCFFSPLKKGVIAMGNVKAILLISIFLLVSAVQAQVAVESVEPELEVEKAKTSTFNPLPTTHSSFCHSDRAVTCLSCEHARSICSALGSLRTSITGCSGE